MRSLTAFSGTSQKINIYLGGWRATALQANSQPIHRHSPGQRGHEGLDLSYFFEALSESTSLALAGLTTHRSPDYVRQ